MLQFLKQNVVIQKLSKCCVSKVLSRSKKTPVVDWPISRLGDLWVNDREGHIGRVMLTKTELVSLDDRKLVKKWDSSAVEHFLKVLGKIWKDWYWPVVCINILRVSFVQWDDLCYLQRVLVSAWVERAMGRATSPSPFVLALQLLLVAVGTHVPEAHISKGFVHAFVHDTTLVMNRRPAV